MSNKRRFIGVWVSLVVIVSVMVSCGGGPAPSPSPVPATVAPVPTTAPAPPTATKAPPTATAIPATPTAKAPKVGGSLMFALTGEPNTLDPQVSTAGGMTWVMRYVGGSVLAKDPKTDAYVPYLAESYNISEDGLTWNITFKKGLKWHDGTPFTAKDYAWTLKRSKTVPSPATAPLLKGMTEAVAVDDLTVRITFAVPNFGLLDGLTSAFLLPLPQAYIERVGEEYSRKPIGLGPYKFKEWKTGDRIVVERNPDFAWGPPYSRGGAPYIETITFRFIPEYATILAGLEAGEIQYADVQTKDLERLRGGGQFQFLETLFQGAGPFIVLNVTRPPLDDVRVRQALNLAVNREALIKVVGLSQGMPLAGPLSPAVRGYWPGVEKIGYGYDLARAKSLLKDAGYAPGAGGMWEKDGKPLSLVLSVYASMSKASEILQEQFKELGIGIKMDQKEGGVLSAQIRAGDFDMVIEYWEWPDSTILYALFHTAMIGTMNLGRVSVPDVDQLANDIMQLTDAKLRQERTDALQKLSIERAYMVPLYTLKYFKAMSTRVKGATHSSVSGYTDFFDAYME